MTANTDIRAYALSKGVLLWQVADELGIADTSFSRKLRKPLADDEKQKIITIIDTIASESNSN